MKAIRCEMCFSTDLVKQDGLFVCQSCGTKYAPDEARKLMVEIDGKVDVTGSTVKVDESSKIENYYTMAKNAYEAGNKKEAEAYCNKIIEIDTTNHNAWFLKGKAAGWQSTLKNLRIEESVNCFSKAIDNATEDDVEEIKEEAAKEISSLSTALMILCCDNFEKYPSKYNEKDILDNLRLAKVYSILLLNKCGVAPTEFNKKVANLMTTAVCNAWKNEITEDYQHSEHPSKYTWETFKDRCFSCINIIEAAITLSDDDKEEDIQRYNNLIKITKELIGSCSYTYNVNGYYSPEWSLSAKSKYDLEKKIEEYRNKIKTLKQNYGVVGQAKALNHTPTISKETDGEEISDSFKVGIYAGVVGLVLFLIIVLVGLICYGKVYLFNGYLFTSFLASLSISLMVVGAICALIKIVKNLTKKENDDSKK